jgi:hypothetical protein
MGGVVALVLTWFATTTISRYFLETTWFHSSTAVLGVLGGALIGLVGSAASVARHLRDS